MTAHSCRDCQHRMTPGLSDPGYCSARPELPLAFGTHHPLRKLPQDLGAECDKWEERVSRFGSAGKAGG
jgi:hypothetical protein